MGKWENGKMGSVEMGEGEDGECGDGGKWEDGVCGDGGNGKMGDGELGGRGRKRMVRWSGRIWIVGRGGSVAWGRR